MTQPNPTVLHTRGSFFTLARYVTVLAPFVCGACDLISGSDRDVTSIVVTPATLSFDAVGQTESLSAEVYDQDDALMDGVRIAWSTSNPDVAIVDESGLVTATGNGSASVFASVRRVSGSASTEVLQVPVGLEIASGNGQEGAAGELLPDPIRVRALDRLGSPAADVAVHFEVSGGAGSVTTREVVTDADGTGSVGWRLGETAGVPQSLEGRVQDVPELAVGFEATAVAGPPAVIVKEGGDGQAAERGTALPDPLRASVRDRFGNPIESALVTWSVVTGGGAADPSAGITDENGVVASAWVLGTPLGPQTIVASSPGVEEPVFFSAVSLAVPDEVRILEGAGQTALVGASVPTTPRILLLDAIDLPVPFTAVEFLVEAGGGSLSAAGSSGPVISTVSVPTDENGQASPPAWTLGTVSGTNRLRVSAGEAPPAFVTAEGLPGPVAFIGKVAGDGQTGIAGAPLPFPVAVLLHDAFGNPVSGVQVEFTAGPDFGFATPPLAVSQSNGQASVQWTLGPGLGPQQLAASYSPTGLVAFGATAQAAGGGGGGGGPGFDIVFEYVNPVDPQVEAVFENAAARWEEIIVGDVPDMNDFTVDPGNCSNPTAEGPFFDDLQIMITIAPFDGPGGILGAAGPCWVRATTFLPFIGQITIDQADVAVLLAQGRLESVVLHEVGHVLGITSTIWTLRGLLVDPSTPNNPTPPDTHFVGPQAIAAFNSNGGAGYSGAKVPVENQHGQGTVNSHWRESVLTNELMTGFLSGATQPLSEITAASLSDLGYVVDLDAADSFSVPGAMPPLGPPLGPPSEPIREVILPPMGAVDPSGDVVPVPGL